MKKVSVIILNYKNKEDTLVCIESVKKSNYKDLNILVVDNNSKDGIEKSLEKEKVEFVQTNQNLGYTGGNNIGIKKVLDQKTELVLILNPDTIINSDTISNLVDGLVKFDADIVGPKIYFGNDKIIWYAGGIIDKLNVLGRHRGLDQKDDGQYEKPEETDFVTGAAILIKKQVFEKVGFFDERYFLYLEDMDFCFKAKKVGFKIMYIPKAIVFHKNAKSTGLGSNLQDYFITRNRMLFASIHLPFRTQFALFREAIRNLGSSARRLALFDFMFGKFGKGSYIHD